MSAMIRTPMNGVVGLSELLLERLSDETSRRYARLIGESGATMMELLGGVLDLAKLDAGRLTFADNLVDLRRLLGDSLALIGAPATRKGLETRLEIDPALPAVMHGDRLRLRQILANLIGNAVKFTEHGHITLHAHAEGERLHITVEDSGIGIAPEDQIHVFEEFVQAGPAGQRHGLGLPIARRLVEAMGGRSGWTARWDRERDASGLPAKFRDDRRAAPARPQPRPGSDRALNVLVVEDNLTNQIIAAGMLKRLGHHGDGGRWRPGRGHGDGCDRWPPLRCGADGHADAGDGRAGGGACLARGGRGPDHLPIVAVTANAYEEDIAACLARGCRASGQAAAIDAPGRGDRPDHRHRPSCQA
jgi:CheY-like chemotaxis protein